MMWSGTSARASPARPLVVIVTGPPASGKSTLAPRLAAGLGLPYLSKDLFKETLFDELGWSDREWSVRLGHASMALLYRTAAELLRARQSVVLESPFYAEWDTQEFRKLEARFGCRFAQVVCCASGPTLVERFRRRVGTPERHPGHTDAASLEPMLARLLHERWDALELAGPVFRVDTETRGGLPIDALVGEIRPLLAWPSRS